MNEGQKQSYKKAISSLITNIKIRKISVVQAKRDFALQLQKDAVDEADRMELIEELNQQIAPISTSQPLRQQNDSPSENNSQIIIDGPSSVRAGNTITLQAKSETEEFGHFFWSTEGNIEGVNHGQSGENYIITADPTAKSGALLVNVEDENGGIGSATIQVIGAGTQDKEGVAADETEEKPSTSEENDDVSAAPVTPEEDDQEGAEGSTEQLQDALKKKTVQTAEKEVAEQAEKKAAINLLKKEGWAALWELLLPILPWIIGAILIIVVALALFAVFTRKSNDGSLGSTIHQPLDSASDQQLLAKTLINSGDSGIKKVINNNVMPDMQKQLIALKSSADPTTAKKIDAVSLEMDQFSISQDSTLGTKIIGEIKDILSTLSQQAPTITVPTRAPLDNISDYNFYLHYGTPLNTSMPNNGQGHGTYMFYGQGKADAVDLYSTAGSAIYPIFSGKIVDFSDDGTGHKKIVIQNGDYELLYANFDPTGTLVVGQNIDKGTSIGKIVDINGEDQLHIELAYRGVPIITTQLDKVYHDAEDKPWGQYLWTTMKKVLNLP